MGKTICVACYKMCIEEPMCDGGYTFIDVDANGFCITEGKYKGLDLCEIEAKLTHR